jgi:glyoxylase-like metal-dependent hydrolase (beta-lactamase superfamily II)
VEIAPDVHAIHLTSVRVHAILEDEITLIDAGLPGSRRGIERYLSRVGRSLDEVRRVVITHGHPDHAGGARELARRGIELLMHPADAEGLRVGLGDAVRRPSRGRFFAAVTPLPAAVTPVGHGDVLPVLGGLRVVHTPGHTPGSICLYGIRDRILFTGDVLQRRRGRVSYASGLYSDDHAAARRSVQRLADLDVRMIVFAHFPTLHEGANEVLAELAGLAASAEVDP